MPKIIEDLAARLITEAQKQIEQNGYSNVTIRGIAQGCDVGVGTVYDYFPSKEALIATYLLEDWRRCVGAIASVASCSESSKPVVCCIYDQLIGFISRHGAIFHDKTAASGFAGSFSPYHSLLRQQLAQPLEKFCPDAFTAEFISEALLTWTVAGRNLEEIYTLIEKIL